MHESSDPALGQSTAFREIAESLGRPVTTIQAQLARALRSLKDAWNA